MERAVADARNELDDAVKLAQQLLRMTEQNIRLTGAETVMVRGLRDQGVSEEKIALALRKPRSYADKMCDDARRHLEDCGYLVVPPNAETTRRFVRIETWARGMEARVDRLEKSKETFTRRDHNNPLPDPFPEASP